VEHFMTIELLTIVGAILGLGVPLLYLSAIIIAHIVRLRRTPPLPRAIARRSTTP
jgi:hypothetical protein